MNLMFICVYPNYFSKLIKYSSHPFSSTAPYATFRASKSLQPGH